VSAVSAVSAVSTVPADGGAEDGAGKLDNHQLGG
jgi:hypothetical protein